MKEHTGARGSKHVEAHGRKRNSGKELDHIRIHAADGATADNPGWLVIHHFSPAESKSGLFNHQSHEPETYHFDDHEAMLDHIAQHTGTEAAHEQGRE